MSRAGWRSPFGRIWIRFFLFLSLAQVFTFLVGLFLMSSIGAEIVVKTTRALAVLIETTNLFMARYLFTTIGVITFLSLGSSWWFTKRISQPSPSHQSGYSLR